MADATTLRLTNTLTRTMVDFAPLDWSDPAIPDAEKRVRMYVCGPTVYDHAHIGNARPAIVFDVLYRLLRHLYGAARVTYVRNITDVDDKINARALRDHGAEIAAGRLTLNEAIRRVTEPTFEQYRKDVAALGCLEPTHQPRATDFVLPRADGKADMATLIQSLVERGHAYAANGESGREILFDVASMPDYGQLSKRNLEDQQAGARVAVEAHKKNPADFVLWKESSRDEPGWEAAFTVDGNRLSIRGRPGWHIECSAMSEAYLGKVFDIHGGGLDLIFPHHENEIAQSRCAHGTSEMARVWMHNGFLQVEGKKMSKSEGNFVTIHDLLETEKFGGRKWPGEVLRLAMLMTHYREPIDFSVRRLEEAERMLVRWRARIGGCLPRTWWEAPPSSIVSALCDDLSIAEVLTAMHKMADTGQDDALSSAMAFIGILPSWAQEVANLTVEELDEKLFRQLQRSTIFSKLAAQHAGIGDNVDTLISARLAFIRDKNWAEADRIRDELLAQGIQLKDGKDPATGERVTTWEVRR